MTGRPKNRQRHNGHMDTDRGGPVSGHALLSDLYCHDAMAGCAVAVAVHHRCYCAAQFWYMRLEYAEFQNFISAFIYILQQFTTLKCSTATSWPTRHSGQKLAPT